MQRFTTDDYTVYICQGGTGREDWRELDYYGVSRHQPHQTLRLRAYLRSPGYYALNGTTRYDIDSSFLTVSARNQVLMKQPIRSCIDGKRHYYR